MYNLNENIIFSISLSSVLIYQWQPTNETTDLVNKKLNPSLITRDTKVTNQFSVSIHNGIVEDSNIHVGSH